MHIVVGTAGHIDHGKTALVKALTGTDTDRLPEEKQRGITIDLGFAEMLSGDVQVGFVDVPGHERFVKNMLAGASGIDLVLLVVAGDEGVMPQTREHFDICRLLHIKQGITVLTKSDLADAETLELARLDVQELVRGSFMESAPTIAVSSKTGQGIDQLKQAIIQAALDTSARTDRLVTRLPIDRSFAVKGFGTVVTGTLVSGSTRPGDELELLPEGKRLRVRGVQTHGKSVDHADAGQRTAVNLGGIDHARVNRGMMLAEPGILRPGQVFDAEVEILSSAARPLRSRQRVRVGLGTAEILARVAVVGDSQEVETGEKGFVQLRLESPLAAVTGERFILRAYSPQTTIGGGTILRAAAEKLKRKNAQSYEAEISELAQALNDDQKLLGIIVRSAGEKGASMSEIRAVTGWKPQVLEAATRSLLNDRAIFDAGGTYLVRAALETLRSRAVAEIEAHHRKQPLARGLSLEALREKVFRRASLEIQRYVLAGLERTGEIVADREVVRLASHGTRLSPAEQAVFDRIRALYGAAGLEVPKLDDALARAREGSKLGPGEARKVFQVFLDSGELVAVSGEYYFASKVVANLSQKIRQFADRNAGRLIDVAAFKEIAGVSRKYAIPLLEYFDRTKVTARSGDKRVVL